MQTHHAEQAVTSPPASKLPTEQQDEMSPLLAFHQSHGTLLTEKEAKEAALMESTSSERHALQQQLHSYDSLSDTRTHAAARAAAAATTTAVAEADVAAPYDDESRPLSYHPAKAHFPFASIENEGETGQSRDRQHSTTNNYPLIFTTRREASAEGGTQDSAHQPHTFGISAQFMTSPLSQASSSTSASLASLSVDVDALQRQQASGRSGRRVRHALQHEMKVQSPDDSAPISHASPLKLGTVFSISDGSWRKQPSSMTASSDSTPHRDSDATRAAELRLAVAQLREENLQLQLQLAQEREAWQTELATAQQDMAAEHTQQLGDVHHAAAVLRREIESYQSTSTNLLTMVSTLQRENGDLTQELDATQRAAKEREKFLVGVIKDMQRQQKKHSNTAATWQETNDVLNVTIDALDLSLDLLRKTST